MASGNLNPLKSSSFSFFDLLRNGNNNAVFIDDMNRLHMMNNLYNIPNPTNAASPLCTDTEKLDPVTKKHVSPYDGFQTLGTKFTQVNCLHKDFLIFRTTISRISMFSLIVSKLTTISTTLQAN